MVSHKRKQKFRVITQDIAKIIMDVRNYFERSNVNRPVERVLESVSAVTKKIENGELFCDEEFRNRDMQAPDDKIPVV
jgi:hypothetical protein